MAARKDSIGDNVGHARGTGPREFISEQCDPICPVCGAKLISEKCKIACRSERCRYWIVFNCAVF
jgi:hypothetical protein